MLPDQVLHTFLADKLPREHPLAFEDVTCFECEKPVHVATNEIVREWVETGKGPICLACYTGLGALGTVVREQLGLPELGAWKPG